MHADARFVYDSLLPVVERYGATHVYRQSWSASSRKHIAWVEHSTTIRFVVGAPRLPSTFDFRVETPDFIDLKYVDRALIELERSHGIDHGITEEYLAKHVQPGSIRDAFIGLTN